MKNWKNVQIKKIDETKKLEFEKTQTCKIGTLEDWKIVKEERIWVEHSILKSINNFKDRAVHSQASRLEVSSGHMNSSVPPATNGVP